MNGTLGREISGSRERSVWMRDLLAEDVLAPLGHEPIGDPEEQVTEATAGDRERRSSACGRRGTPSTATSPTSRPPPREAGCPDR